MNSFSRFPETRRITQVRLNLVGIFLFFVSSLLICPFAEAGLFDKLKAKRKANSGKLKQGNTSAASPRPRHRSYYHDAHKDAYINEPLLAVAGDASRKIVIDIGRQRAFLIVRGLVAIDSAVSTARRGKFTPRGSFTISERVKEGKTSTIYHVYMPYWMRLGNSTVGMHVGDLPGYPASAGCIRLPQSVAPVFFEHTSVGVAVEVVDSWNEENLLIPYSIRKPAVFADT